MFNLGHGDFRCLVFDLFFMEHDEILQLLMLPFVLDLEFIKPVIVLFSEFEFGVNFVGKFLPDVSEKGHEVIGFSSVGSKGILQLGSEGFDISLVKL